MAAKSKKEISLKEWSNLSYWNIAGRIDDTTRRWDYLTGLRGDDIHNSNWIPKALFQGFLRARLVGEMDFMPININHWFELLLTSDVKPLLNGCTEYKCSNLYFNRKKSWLRSLLRLQSKETMPNNYYSKHWGYHTNNALLAIENEFVGNIGVVLFNLRMILSGIRNNEESLIKEHLIVLKKFVTNMEK